MIHRYYLEVLRSLVRDARKRGDLRADSDTDALLSLLLMIFPHLAPAPYVRGLVAVLAAAFSPVLQAHRNELKQVGV